MKKILILSVVILFFINSVVLAATSMEAKLASELARINGVKMALISFTLEEGLVTGAAVNIRSKAGYKFTKEQKSVIKSFVASSAPGLIVENVALNISEDPVISFATNLVFSKSPETEKKLATKLASLMPVQEIYVNFTGSEKNFLGEYSVKPVAAILVKLPENYEFDDEKVLSIVDTLCKSVQDLSMENIMIINTRGQNVFQMIK
jgi:flagellar biosynthesis/type III secretory pathway M-ring protein FliF/YscJ